MVKFMLTNAKIHTLVSQHKMTPEMAAEILVAHRARRQTARSHSFFGMLAVIAIAMVASLFGARSDRA